MIKLAAIVLVVLIGGLLIYVATRPDAFRVERSAAIKAPPEKIFAFINDLRQWTLWSPWENIDPALKRTYSGAAGGKGAAYAWEGNSKVGAGRMEILESVPGSKIAIKLDFFKPFEGHNVAEFTFTRAGDVTTVGWAMFGPSPYMSKVMGLVINMDRMIGGQFETGLANLKSIAEK
jgi:uncharacterized protein YndB with AHSA1/START domain